MNATQIVREGILSNSLYKANVTLIQKSDKDKTKKKREKKERQKENRNYTPVSLMNTVAKNSQ
jgi:hypothetical protein